MDTDATTPEDVLELQRTVQRKLGRCLLHLQQYESLLKLVIAHGELSGPPDQFKATRERRIAHTRKLTLGTLMGLLTENHMVPNLDDRERSQEEPSPDDQFWLSFRTLIEILPEHFETTKIALKELVDLRNELVHHFTERFDIWTLEGCIAANTFLEENDEIIGRHYRQLQSWAKSVGESRLEAFRAMETLLVERKTNGTL